MTLLFMDSMDFAANTTEIRRRWPGGARSTSITAITSGGIWGGPYMRMTEDDVGPARGIPARSNLFFSAHHQCISIGTDRLLEFKYLDGFNLVFRLVEFSNRIQVYRGSLVTHLASSRPCVWASDAWFHLEIFVSISNAVSEGRVEARINGQTVLEFDGDTADSTAAINNIRLMSDNGNGDWDDVVIWDDLGGANEMNDWQGPMRIVTLNPNGATAESGWDNPLDTDENYLQVDDPLAPDENTSYIESATDGATDRYELEDITDTIVEEKIAAIHGVQVQTEVMKPDAGNAQITQIMEVNGSELTDGPKHIKREWSFQTYASDLNPDGGGAWTVAAVNAMTVGQEYHAP